jgi:hypothetical protein
MQVIVKYYGDLIDYFNPTDEEHTTRVDIDDQDSVITIIERYKIPRDKINLVLVNGVNVKIDECENYRFSDGDTLAIWPITV